MKISKPLIIAAAVVLAGCGEAKKSAQVTHEVLQRRVDELENENLRLSNEVWNAQRGVGPQVITREQLAGIYRRLVELEKRAGIRDAEGEKVEATGNILMGDTHSAWSRQPESQESPRHEH